jgi:hypothetical protein
MHKLLCVYCLLFYLFMHPQTPRFWLFLLIYIYRTLTNLSIAYEYYYRT